MYEITVSLISESLAMALLSYVDVLQTILTRALSDESMALTSTHNSNSIIITAAPLHTTLMFLQISNYLI